jgi:hypothetical protein
MSEKQFESNQMMWDRAQRVKAYMQEHIAKNPLNDKERIAVVCHSTLIKAMWSTGFDDKGRLNGYHPKNCEIQPFNL